MGTVAVEPEPARTFPKPDSFPVPLFDERSCFPFPSSSLPSSQPTRLRGPTMASAHGNRDQCTKANEEIQKIIEAAREAWYSQNPTVRDGFILYGLKLNNSLASSWVD